MMKKRKILPFFVAFGAVMLFSLRAQASGVCDHNFQPFEKAPTCTESGYRGEQCTLCFQTRGVQFLPQLGHEWSEWSVVSEATCSEEGQEQRTCGRCSQVETAALEKLTHSYSVWVQAPTCGRDGYTLHTCTECGHKKKTDPVQKLGHQYEVTLVLPTCTADGYTRYRCVNCTDSYKTDPTPKTGHNYDAGVVTKEASLTASGKIKFTCVNCGDTYTSTIPKWVNPFTDIAEDGFYFDSVLWAYNRGITNGIDATHFGPGEICTRAQVVTFLWREAGEPKAQGTQCPFVDVKTDAYYSEAILWAVEEGITNGVDATHFAPNQVCTRGQVVTFLYRANGSPESGGQESFTDVEPQNFFYEPVCWAFRNGITTGINSTTFSPKLNCTRGQIVTFLYRARNQ